MYQPENHPRLGVCYYPEHWPEDTWEDDAARMKALGLSTVRIAEFAWAKMEPEPGVSASLTCPRCHPQLAPRSRA